MPLAYDPVTLQILTWEIRDFFGSLKKATRYLLPEKAVIKHTYRQNFVYNFKGFRDQPSKTPMNPSS